MNVLEILHKIGYTDLRDFGNSYRTRPLYRSSDNNTSLSIKKDSGKWYDFSERIGGYLPQLVQITLQLSTLEEAKEFLGGEGAMPVVKENKNELSAIKKFDRHMLSRLIKKHDYWIERGVKKDTLEMLEGGVTYNGKMSYRYVFPILNLKDELIGFSGRALNNDPNYPKWKHIGAKTNWCYPLKWNIQHIMDKRQVILVESIGDMLSLWDNGIKNVLVTFGVDVSPKIIEFLLKIDANKIIIAFNNDEENNFVGNRASEDAKTQLCKFFDESQIVIAIPTKKDFGEMDSQEITLWHQKLN